MKRFCIAAAGLGGAIAVMMAAYGAHGVEAQAAEWLEKGSRMQLIHSAALLALGMGQAQGRWLKAASGLFFLGTILFSGSLYAMALASSPIVFTVPIGGTCFILGWLAVLGSAFSPDPIT